MVTLLENAANRVKQLQEKKGNPNLMLRLSIDAGGCSGFQYSFGFSEETNDDDHVFENHGVKLVVDDVSLDLIDGAEIDFVEQMVGSAFQVKNPNAESGCGCGSSFSV